MAEITQNGAEPMNEDVAQAAPQDSPAGRVAPDWLRAQIRQLRGRGSSLTDYLDAKWGLAWLRWEFPDATIETRLLEHDPGKGATFVATIVLPDGGNASGHGSETKADFGDYLEKAETKAVRRALAHLGYSPEMLEALTGETGGGSQVGTPVASSRQEQAPPPVTGDAREAGSYAWVMAEIAAGAADGDKFTTFYNTYIAKLQVKEEQNAARRAAQARRQ